MLTGRLAGHTLYLSLSPLIGLVAASRSANSAAGPQAVSLSSDRKFVHTSSSGQNSIPECSRMFSLSLEYSLRALSPGSLCQSMEALVSNMQNMDVDQQQPQQTAKRKL